MKVTIMPVYIVPVEITKTYHVEIEAESAAAAAKIADGIQSTSIEAIVDCEYCATEVRRDAIELSQDQGESIED